MPFGQSLAYPNVIANYHNIFYVSAIRVHSDIDFCPWFQWTESIIFVNSRQTPLVGVHGNYIGINIDDWCNSIWYKNDCYCGWIVIWLIEGCVHKLLDIEN